MQSKFIAVNEKDWNGQCSNKLQQFSSAVIVLKLHVPVILLLAINLLCIPESLSHNSLYDGNCTSLIVAIVM